MQVCILPSVIFVSFTTAQFICSVPAVICAITEQPFFHADLIGTPHHACRTFFTRRRRWWCSNREIRKSSVTHSSDLCKPVWSIQIKVKTLLSSCDGTHREERSLRTPAGRWPRLLFGPGSVGSETGFEKLWEYGLERCYPPSRLGYWWPQDATLRPQSRPGKRWKPTRV